MGVKVKGLDKALANLDKKNQAIIDAVKDTLANVATDIEIQAIRDAPSSWEG